MKHKLQLKIYATVILSAEMKEKIYSLSSVYCYVKL
jgi:hypothetical protein